MDNKDSIFKCANRTEKSGIWVGINASVIFQRPICVQYKKLILYTLIMLVAFFNEQKIEQLVIFQ